MNALKLTLVALGSVATVGAAQAALTLNTAGFIANNIYTMSALGAGTAEAASVTISPVGNTVALAPITVVNPETETDISVTPMQMPITKAAVNVKLFSSPLAEPVNGEAMRSALKFTRTVGSSVKSAVYGNFRVVFGEQTLYADVFNRAGTTKGIKAMTFIDNKDTVVSLKGFQFTMKGSVKELRFTEEAVQLIGGADGMALPSVFMESMRITEFGKLDIDVSLKSRKPKANATPLTAADFTL